jgi:uncharacterized protein (TIRG00374 family)
MTRSGARLALRILITAVTLVLFARGMHLQSLPERLGHVRWEIVVPAFLLNTAWIWPSALRWRGVARLSGVRLPFRDAVRFTVIGSFFNAFLPTGNGGDAVRGFLASRRLGHPLGAMLGTVLAERIIGMAVTLCFVVAGGLFFLTGTRVPANVPASAAFLLLCMAAGTALLASRKFRSLLKSALRIVPLPAFHDGARQAARVLDAFRGQLSALASAAGWSAANQAVPIVSSWMLSMAVPGLDAPFLAFCVVIPLSFVAALLPSIGGYGVREAGYILFLGWFGVQAGPAAVFGVIRLLFLWSFAFAGAVLYISGWHGKERTSIRSSLRRE